MEAMRCYFPLDAHLYVYRGGRGLTGFYSGSCHSFCCYELCLLSDKCLFFFNGMKPLFGVFILPCSNQSVLNVTVSN